jgi:hypothetical protein
MSESSELGGSEQPTDELAKYVEKVRSEIIPFDPSLESLVALVNLMDSVEVGITLHVKGAVVSGMLISSRSYFNLLVHTLRESSGGDFLATFFEPTLQEQKDAREKYRTQEIPLPRPLHVHVRQAATYLTGGNEPLVSAIWRGRLTEVDAWSMGNFGVAPPPLPDSLAV